ncbi:hypothetical protein R3P38DRAFT_3196761 [Favolaschia claudopus]|uniref:Uncharacterized protein n=1 Tax=Favolaschia claudopus TaxID=2862362 RepID=A0AAW0B532_9AGAR
MLRRYLSFNSHHPARGYTPEPLDDMYRMHDSDTHIEDRAQPGKFFDRTTEGSCWHGHDDNPTWVPAYGVPLDAPPPPYVPERLRVNNRNNYYTVAPARHNAYGYDQRRGRSMSPRRHSAPRDRRYRQRSITPEYDDRYDQSPPRFSRTPSTRTATTSTSNSRGSHQHWGRRRSRTRSRSPSPPRSPPRLVKPYRPRGGKRGGVRYNPIARKPRKLRTVADKAAEDKLRREALQSRAFKRTVFPPDITKAIVDPDGHPRCPPEGDPDPPSTVNLDDEGIITANWAALELLRRTEALEANPSGGDEARPNPPPDTGGWRGLRVNDTVQAANLVSWVRRTEQTAYAFMTYTCAIAELFPTTPRTEGETYLLAKYADTRRTYWERVSGHPDPPSDFTRNWAADVEDVEMGHIYVGDAELSAVEGTICITGEYANGSGTVLSATHCDLEAAIRLYERLPTSEWPRGLRVTPTTFPNLSVVEFASPYKPDVRAWFTIQAVCPHRTRKGSSLQRARFFDLLIRILSVRGAFHRIAQFGQYPPANLPLEHYPFYCDNITESQVVCWLVQHGISKEGEAISILEDFARARRNFCEGFCTTETRDYTSRGWPHHQQDVLSLPEGLVVKWAELEHGLVYPGAQTSYPRKPSEAAV